MRERVFLVKKKKKKKRKKKKKKLFPRGALILGNSKTAVPHEDEWLQSIKRCLIQEQYKTNKQTAT